MLEKSDIKIVFNSLRESLRKILKADHEWS